jgi:hypothetical protein
MSGVSLGKSKVLRATAKALLADTPDHGELWIPKSVIHDDSEVFDDGENDSGDLVIDRRWAEKEQLT